MRGSVYEWICRAPKGYFISSGNASGVMTGRRALIRIPNNGGFPWMRMVFQRNSVHGSRMRILYGFFAKGQKFVCIRLEERFPNVLKNNEDSYAQIREVITKINTKNKFLFHCQDSMTPSTN
jgi:hypothetical protein